MFDTMSEQKRKVLVVAFLGFSILATSLIVYFYQIFFSKNFLIGREDSEIYIAKGTDFDKLSEQLRMENVMNDAISFGFVARYMKYKDRVKPGRYLLKANMSNVEAVRALRGSQIPVTLTFNNARTKKDLAGKLCRTMPLDSVKIFQMLNDVQIAKKYSLDTTTIMSMFLPNTYEIYWTATEEEVFDRMHKEYSKFWTQARKDKAQKISLSPTQVSILASIVEAESKVAKEQPTIAGVYLNRLNTNMPLQADPTVVFALGDFSIKRVLNSHLAIDSPYNTYKYTGLPPGNINLPSIQAIDAVLNYEKHKYLFFCAKEDFSGSHNFAVTLSEHNANADKYRNALDKMKIKK
jgi:UPF0755 protein